MGNTHLCSEMVQPLLLVPPEQVAGVDLARHVGQLVAPAVGDDEVAAGLERLEVARDLAF